MCTEDLIPWPYACKANGAKPYATAYVLISANR